MRVFALGMALLLSQGIWAQETPADPESAVVLATKEEDPAENIPPLPKQKPPLRITADVSRRVLAQGVPVKAWKRLVDFYNSQLWKGFKQKTYSCPDTEPHDMTPCLKKERTPSARVAYVRPSYYAAIVDYKKVSTQRRFYLIDLRSGAVEKHLVSHGKGSGKGLIAAQFSNRDNSRQTSLGLYVTGSTYYGKYGRSLRLFGLDKSNDNAYVRDIVMHQAHYASEGFPFAINKKTKKPYGRLGLSWGCPALSPSVGQRLISALKDGALLYHYHADYIGKAPTVSAPPVAKGVDEQDDDEP